MNRPNRSSLFDSMKSLLHYAASLTAGAVILISVTPASVQAAAGDLQIIGQVNGGLASKGFGHTVTAVGTNRFAVSTPFINTTTTNGVITNAGVVNLFHLPSNYVNSILNPDP